MGVSLSEDGTKMKIYSQMNFINRTNADIIGLYEKEWGGNLSYGISYLMCNMFTFPRIIVSSGVEGSQYAEYLEWSKMTAKQIGVPVDGYTADLAIKLGYLNNDYSLVSPNSYNEFLTKYWPVQIV
jgi:hypothetical protein